MLRIFLVPGFFGFSTVGRMRYFQHVHAALEHSAKAQELALEIHEVPTLPTAALDRRAERLAAYVGGHASAEDRIVIIGHSTGGIDARMVASPNSGLTLAPEFERCRPGLRAVLSVSSPHHGSPLAHFFASINGERMLRVLSVLTLSLVRLGGWRSSSVQRLMRGFEVGASDPGLWDSVTSDVLHAFDDDARGQLEAFLGEVRKDRGLLRDLTPVTMRARQPRMVDAPGLAYGSVLTCAPSQQDLPVGVSSRQTASEWLFRFLHGRCVEESKAPAGEADVDASWARGLKQDMGRNLSTHDNDGFVPLVSQVHGKVVAARRADHLDILGYCVDSESPPVHANWLRSFSGFSSAEFDETWARIGAWALSSVHAAP